MLALVEPVDEITTATPLKISASAATKPQGHRSFLVIPRSYLPTRVSGSPSGRRAYPKRSSAARRGHDRWTIWRIEAAWVGYRSGIGRPAARLGAPRGRA